MNEKPTQPSILKIGLQDTISVVIAFIILGLPFGLVGIFLETSARDRNSDFWTVVGIVVLIIILCIAFLVWRVRRKKADIHALWSRGIVSQANILSIQDVGAGRYRQRLLRYTYNYNGDIYEESTQVARKWTPTDDTVAIIIDPQNPEKTLLISQYT